MKAVILNWQNGENDPFSFANKLWQKHLRAFGKNADIIEITEPGWPTRLTELCSDGVEFALTSQGLGSNVTIGERGESLWDHLRIPLICLHADHPSHMPSNHQLESRYCFHLYAFADFARYSNRHFRRLRSAGVFDLPQAFREPRLERREGDYFVFAKNINDPIATEKLWQQQLDKPMFDAYMVASETLKSRLTGESYVDIHDELDDLINEQNWEWLSPSKNLAGYHKYHSQLDHHLRSHKSVVALAALREFPVRIYGRGWDRIVQNAPAHHVFQPGRNMADSQDLYYTRFGLIDISPSTGLHDRTLRAMANGGAFLSSANLEDSVADIDRFAPLFFDFRTDVLSEKCAAVLQNPEEHLMLARQFAHFYQDRFHVSHLISKIDLLAKMASSLDI